MVRIVFLLTFFYSVSGQPNSGPGALDNLQYFRVLQTASFTCTTIASRCIFQESDYSPISYGGGTQGARTDGTSWTVNDPSNVLTLSNCGSGSCIVTCFADCSCTENGSACATTTPFPTAAPTFPNPTKAPTPKNCPKKTDTSRCPTLMPSVPLSRKCDCYNFCQFNFTSCCEEGGSCGNTECSVVPGSNPGEVGSYVWGCTDDDRASSPATSPNSQPTQGSSPSSANVNTRLLSGVLVAVGLSFLWL